jgi:hypothetical protein
LVLEAFDTLLNKRGYEAAERFRSPNHSTARTSNPDATAGSI